jgi:hypothetical protein
MVKPNTFNRIAVVEARRKRRCKAVGATPAVVKHQRLWVVPIGTNQKLQWQNSFHAHTVPVVKRLLHLLRPQ